MPTGGEGYRGYGPGVEVLSVGHTALFVLVEDVATTILSSFPAEKQYVQSIHSSMSHLDFLRIVHSWCKIVSLLICLLGLFRMQLFDGLT